MWYNVFMSLECNICKNVLPVEKFSKKNSSRRGYSYRCKDCHNTYMRDTWYVNNRQKQIKSTAKWKQKRREFVYNYLLSHPCECGESDPAALDFDHDDPSIKNFTIGRQVANLSDEKLLDEIEKCTVRCANCHRKRTAQQFGWYAFITAL